jgi:hypothetical protein
MPKFITYSQDFIENLELHMTYIDVASDLMNSFNINIIGEPSTLVYNHLTKEVQVSNTDFDLHPNYYQIISQHINWLLRFSEQYSETDDYLVHYLKLIKVNYDKESNKTDLNTILKNLSLEEYFGKISATFLKDKINEFLLV